MDSRNVNFSIKKSQIHTHMLSLSQKLTKLDIAWKDKCCMGFWVWFPKNDPEWAFVYILYVFTAFSTPYWHLFCSAPSVVNLVSWSGKNWVGPCLYLEDLSQSLNRRWLFMSSLVPGEAQAIGRGFDYLLRGTFEMLLTKPWIKEK